jgi:SM-20-related protein
MGESVEEVPSPYLQFDDFLDVKDLGRLITFIENHETDLSASGVLAAPGDEDVDIRSSQTLFDLDEIWPMFEGQLGGLLPTIRRELEVPWFTVSHVERQLTVSHDGDFFGLHNDSGGPEVATREVTYVYYFNAEPKQFEGGELWIYDYFDQDFVRHPGQNHVVVEPRNNSIVFFPSWVNHEVRPVHSTTAGLVGSRMTVNGWFHAK